MRKPVTSDQSVLVAIQKTSNDGNFISSSQIAETLNLTVFQITARLKSMELRGVVVRNKQNGTWGLPGGTGAPDTDSVPVIKISRIKKEKWTHKTVWDTGFSGRTPDYIGVWNKSTGKFVCTRFTSIFVDPKGRRWRTAANHEAARLIVAFKDMPPLRITRVKRGEVTYVNPDDAPKPKG